MIVVFEGPKGVGKSTAIKTLSELLCKNGIDNEIMKFERGEVDPTHDMLNALTYLADKTRTFDGFKKVFLIDRFHLSEFVYRHFDKNFPIDEDTTLSDTIMIHRMLMAVRATVVILSCDDEKRKERIFNRIGNNEDIENPERLEFWKSLGEQMKRRYHNVSLIDTTEKTPMDSARIVNTFIQYSIDQKLSIFQETK